MVKAYATSVSASNGHEFAHGMCPARFSSTNFEDQVLPYCNAAPQARVEHEMHFLKQMPDLDTRVARFLPQNKFLAWSRRAAVEDAVLDVRWSFLRI